MSGKNYNRSILCHKFMFEAMERLRFEAFMDTLDEENQEHICASVQKVMSCFPEQEFVNSLHSSEIETIARLYQSFIEKSSEKSKTFAFWSMYIRMIGN